METSRRSGRASDVQGELEGLTGDPAPGVPPPGEPMEPDDAEATATEPVDTEPDDAEDGDADERADFAGPPVDDALRRLEGRVNLLVERYDDLAGRYAAVVEDRRRTAERLARLGGDGTAPGELAERIDALKAENERLSTHARFLEERIQGLLARVRYVMEA